MEDAQRYFIHDDEFRDLYVGLSADGTKYKEERMNLVEIINGLQKYVQSYKTYNERIMRAKEQKDDFNVKLMQSLEKIEKKMNKETETSRSRSCQSHDEKRREARSVGRNHPHSPRHSFRKARNNSSVRYQIYYNRKNINIVENNSGTTQYMKPKHQNNTFIYRKQCSLASSRGKPPAEKCSITIILKKRLSNTSYSYLY
jgi:hypothetical protein